MGCAWQAQLDSAVDVPKPLQLLLQLLAHTHQVQFSSKPSGTDCPKMHDINHSSSTTNISNILHPIQTKPLRSSTASRCTGKLKATLTQWQEWKIACNKNTSAEATDFAAHSQAQSVVPKGSQSWRLQHAWQQLAVENKTAHAAHSTQQERNHAVPAVPQSDPSHCPRSSSGTTSR